MTRTETDETRVGRTRAAPRFSVGFVLHLQRTVGNRAVQRALGVPRRFQAPDPSPARTESSAPERALPRIALVGGVLIAISAALWCWYRDERALCVVAILTAVLLAWMHVKKT